MPPLNRRLAVLYSRLRVEEKWIFAALDKCGTPYDRLNDGEVSFDVDCGNAPGIQLLGRVEAAAGAEAAHEHSVVSIPCPRFVNVEADFAVIYAVVGCAALVQCCKDPFLLHTQP